MAGPDSAAKLLSRAELTASERPKLGSTEVELFVANKVELRIDDIQRGSRGSDKVVLFGRDNGLLFVTTHRLIWQMKHQTSETYSINIRRLFASTLQNLRSTMLARAKIYCEMTADENTSAEGSARSFTRLVFKFSDRGCDEVAENVLRALNQKLWEKDDAISKAKSTKPEDRLALQQQRRAQGFSTSTAGVAGILRMDDLQSKKTDHTISVGLSDLSHLMDKAREMVDIVDRIRHVHDSSSSSAGGGDGSDAVQSSSAEFQEMLLSMGIASPVTRETAGSQFHKQLSRQLADFLAEPLKREGGLMQLTDAFCLFNRARGAELITPDDMVTACELWPKLRLSLTLAKLSSGVNVVQSADVSEEKIVAQLENITSSRDLSGRGLNEFEVSKILGITPVLAREYLMEAERREALCRDNAPDGIRFSANFFREY